MKSNPYVLKYLIGKKRLPKQLPAEYSPGEETEAIYCAHTLKEAWNAHREAKAWLKEHNAAKS